MATLIKRFRDISIADLPNVGGKNSSLGEMFSKLSAQGIQVPDGFATTATAFWQFLDHNGIRQPLQELMKQLDKQHYSNLKEIGAKARKLMMDAKLPDELMEEIKSFYKELSGTNEIDVAVRSSATAEDLPQASFAGQHESY